VEISTPADLGGRATSQATVQWRDGDQIKSEKTDNPTAIVSSLAARFNGEIPELVVIRPSLEDIYLEMIGVVHE
jgi:ABC-2 type transport system ATP-binding protein